MSDVLVLKEDNHLLAIDKPAGISTQPHHSQSDSLEQMAKRFIKERDKKPGDVYLHAVHRLDTPVSGIVIFAKTSKALSRLNGIVREQKLKKTYLALLKNAPNPSQGTLLHYLYHGDRRAIVSDTKREGYKKCSLNYIALLEKENFALIKIELLTGRYHQIRAQFAHIGYPIIGDKKYGGSFLKDYPGIALHHHHCHFQHPVTNKDFGVVAPLPKWPYEEFYT